MNESRITVRMAPSASDSPLAAREESASLAVVEAVAAADDASVLELPPLFDAVDPDALNAVFVDRGANGYAQFRYAGHVVTVRADGTVELADAD